jgi:peptidoglycan/xylan/chitin deacetylase (PgdA/CDA1 family)
MALCYHNIEDGSKMKALTIPVAEFEKEMQQIKDSGFTVIPMQDFVAWRKGEKNIPRKSCIVSIDDGWVSGYTNAWPILKKYGYPFTMFIYINYVGSGGKSLSWAQLEEMRDAGVDIECHTYSHSNLHGKGSMVNKKAQEEIKAVGYDAWLKKEIIESKQVLEKQLGIKCNVFAYPFGIYNSRVREVVKEAGYDAAFTVYGQRLTMHSPPYDLLGRYAVEQGKPKIFQDALAMIGGGISEPIAQAPSVAQLASVSMVTVPMNNETINNPTPVIKANLSTMGEIELGSLEVRVSGVGTLPVQFNPETKMLQTQVVQKLKPGAYTVIVSAKVGGQRAETRWSFNVAPGVGQ